MNRTQAIAGLIGLTLALSLAVFAGTRVRDKSTDARPACSVDEMRLSKDGVLVCGQGAPLPTPMFLSMGGRLHLSRATVQELASIPGISIAVAEAIVAARDSDAGLPDWAAVDRIQGVGPSRMEFIKTFTDIP